MNLKKITAGVLAAVIVVTGAAGCTGKKAEEGKRSAKGKYVEREIELPKNEAENGIGMVQTDDKTLRYYTQDKNTGEYKAYDYDGKEFKEADASWLAPVGEAAGEGLQIIRGEDGKCYAWYMTEGSVNHILREGDSTEVPMPELAEPGDLDLNIYISALKVDSEGNIYIADPIAKKILMYGPEGGSRIRSFEAGASDGTLSMMMDVKGTTLLAMNASGDGFLCYDTKSGEVTSETKYAGGITEGVLRLGDDHDIYFTDEKGIHHLTLGGTVSEDLVDGNASSLGIPGHIFHHLFFGEKSQYYVFAAASDTSGNNFKLYEYVFDKNAKAIPDETLSIYGLTESKTVRQAIANFQQKHPDVGIEYKTGNAGEGTATKEDSIRALNTELLAGNGADVLMLDGLPVQSYIEKGVLDDLSGTVESSGLLHNIVQSYEKDGKIYQIPARFGIPIMAGEKAKTDALKSIDALKAYMDSNPASGIFDGIDAESAMRLFIDINYESLVDKDMKIQTQELASLMELAKQFSDSESENASVGVYMEGGAGESIKSAWDAGDSLGYAQSGTVMSQEIQGIMGMMVPYYSMRANQEEPTDVNGFYVPHDIAGVNKASKQKELAQEFIKTLLSEEVQSLDMGEGFPVNEKAMDAFVQSVEETPDTESGIQIGISSATEEGSSAPVSITLPYRSEVKALTELGKKLTKPVQTDDVIGEMMLDEAKNYFDGTSSSEEAAKAAASKADTYLAQ